MPKLVEGYASRLVVPSGERDVQVFDDALPGFGVRKFATGRASYFVKFNVGTKQRRLTLGAVVQGNLARAWPQIFDEVARAATAKFGRRITATAVKKIWKTRHNTRILAASLAKLRIRKARQAGG